MSIKENPVPVCTPLVITLLLVLNALTLIDPLSFTVEAATVDGSIELDEYGFILENEGGEDMLVLSEGEVSMEVSGTGSNVQSMRVELYIDAGGWQCAVDPETMYFTSSGGEQNFTWWVEVPSTTSAGTYIAEIEGMYYPEPGLLGYGLGTESVTLEVKNETEVVADDQGIALTSNGGAKSELRYQGDDIVWLGADGDSGADVGPDVFSTTIEGISSRKLTGDSAEKWSLEVSKGMAGYVSDDGGGISVVDIVSGDISRVEAGLQEGPQTVPEYFNCDLDSSFVSFIATESNDLEDVSGEDSDVFVHDISSNETVRYSDTDPREHDEQTYACADDDYLLYSTEGGDVTLVDLHTGSIQVSSWWGFVGPLDMDDGVAVFMDDGSYYGDTDILYMELPYLDSLWGVGTWGNDHSPRIDNGRIVWCTGQLPSGSTRPVSGDIYYWDINSWTFAQVTNGSGTNWCPDISGNHIVCLSDRNSSGGGEEVYKYRIAELDMNNPPVVNSIVSDPEMITPGGICIIEVNASDPDEDYLDYHYKVTGGTIQGYGNVVKWLAPDEEGSYILSVAASDGLAKSNWANVTVEVDANAPVDMAPVIDSLDVYPDEVEPGGTVEVTVTAHDENNNTLQYQYMCNGGTFGTDGELTSQVSDIWTAPDMEDVFTLQVTAFDGEYYSDPEEVRVTVTTTPEPKPVNNPPVIGDIQVEPREVLAGSTAVITVSATDEDGDELSYSFSSEAGRISGRGASVDWTAPDTGGTYRINVVVRDIHDAMDTGHVDVSVYTTNEPEDGSDDGSDEAQDTDEPIYEPEKADEKDDGSIPGFSTGPMLVAILATLVLFARVGRRREWRLAGGKARMKLMEMEKAEKER